MHDTITRTVPARTADLARCLAIDLATRLDAIPLDEPLDVQLDDDAHGGALLTVPLPGHDVTVQVAQDGRFTVAGHRDDDHDTTVLLPDVSTRDAGYAAHVAHGFVADLLDRLGLYVLDLPA